MKFRWFLILLAVLLTLLIVSMMTSCASEAEKNLPYVQSIQNGFSYEIIIIDNCEYIYSSSGIQESSNYAYTFTHKGNCKNH